MTSLVPVTPSPIITIESPIRTSRCIPPPPPRPLNVSCASNTCARKSTSPASGTRMYGVTVVNPSRILTSSSNIDIFVFLSSLARSCALNVALGPDRRSLASRASGASSASASAPVASPRARITSIVRSSRSMRASAMSALHALAEVLERAQLQLLHGALRSIERDGNLADTFLVHEPHLNHLPLRVRETPDEIEDHRSPLDFPRLALIGHIRWRILRVAFRRPSPIGQSVGRDAIEPRHERHAAPFEPRQVRQRPLEHRRGDV